MKAFIISLYLAINMRATDGLSTTRSSVLLQETNVKAIHVTNAHESRVASLLETNPQATKALCDACVSAEEILVDNQTAVEEALRDLSVTQKSFNDATSDYATCLVEEVRLKGIADAALHDVEVRIAASKTILNSLVSQMSAIESEVTAPDPDGAEAAADPDKSYDGTGLLALITAWKNAYHAHATQQALCNGKSDLVGNYTSELNDKNATLIAAEAVVDAANATAVAACDAMKAGVPLCDAALVLAINPTLDGSEDDTELQHYHSTFWSAESIASHSPTLDFNKCGYSPTGKDAKTDHWAGYKLGETFTIVAHKQSDGTELSRAVYPVLADYQDCSLYELFNGQCADATGTAYNSHIVFTGQKDTSASTTVGIKDQPAGALAALPAGEVSNRFEVWQGDYPAPSSTTFGGDVFMDYDDALIANIFEGDGSSTIYGANRRNAVANAGLISNRMPYQSSQRSHVRLATTKSFENHWHSAHSFGGIGGRHEHGKNGWVLDYESSPMYHYCSSNQYSGVTYASGVIDSTGYSSQNTYTNSANSGTSNGNARLGNQMTNAGDGVTLATFSTSLGGHPPIGKQDNGGNCMKPTSTSGTHKYAVYDVSFSFHVSGGRK